MRTLLPVQQLAKNVRWELLSVVHQEHRELLLQRGVDGKKTISETPHQLEHLPCQWLIVTGEEPLQQQNVLPWRTRHLSLNSSQALTPMLRVARAPLHLSEEQRGQCKGIPEGSGSGILDRTRELGERIVTASHEPIRLGQHHPGLHPKPGRRIRKQELQRLLQVAHGSRRLSRFEQGPPEH
ncbi:hypothetical protein SAMN05444354_1339 [Stigmatella aurantiaca]|uniref:Uncharacterized protein n=1 Tax=Stigmatella aurantiaca TaxID=41 RepID=A0A1H8EFQ7_STIAU|nr:hypothetical protein [Stigmatella aurantiaca]SEN18411.1 hypothetical protein SAMN05444354_1339 [Stigmatella aurantiaca]